MNGNIFKKLICLVTLVAFVVTSVPLSYAQSVVSVSPLNSMIQPGSSSMLVMLKGIKIDPKDLFRFDFIFDVGREAIDEGIAKKEALRQIRYFLAALTVPEKDLWVNLSPYEKSRMIAEGLSSTEMGGDLLSEDYALKQLTSSLYHPDSVEGKHFWSDIYRRLSEKYGTTDMPVNTFNKVWIMPKKAGIYQDGRTAVVVESALKVMLEKDYFLAKQEQGSDSSLKQGQEEIEPITEEAIRNTLLPVIEKQVNQGKDFIRLRQIYNALILAGWFKRYFKETILGHVYVGKNKINGIDLQSPAFKEQLFAQYLQSFKNGVVNLIREDKDPNSDEIIPRKYFSGGAQLGGIADMLDENYGKEQAMEAVGHVLKVDVVLRDSAAAPTSEIVGAELEQMTDAGTLMYEPQAKLMTVNGKKLNTLTKTMLLEDHMAGRPVDVSLIDANVGAINEMFYYSDHDSIMRVSSSAERKGFNVQQRRVLGLMGRAEISPKVLSYGYTGNDEKDGRYFLEVERVRGKNIEAIFQRNRSLGKEGVEQVVNLLGSLLKNKVLVKDWQQKNIMIGSIGRDSKQEKAYFIDLDAEYIELREDADVKTLADEYLRLYGLNGWSRYDIDGRIKKYLEDVVSTGQLGPDLLKVESAPSSGPALTGRLIAERVFASTPEAAKKPTQTGWRRVINALPGRPGDSEQAMVNGLQSNERQQIYLAHLDDVYGFVPAEDPVAKAVSRIGQEILREKGFDPQEYMVVLVDSDDVNAMVYPDLKVIMFYRGLVDFLRRHKILNEDVIRYILGHEIGHLIEARKKKAAESKGEEFSHSSLSEEYAADQHGLSALETGKQETSYNPLAAVLFMRALRMEQKTPLYATTHPQHHRREVKLYNDIRTGYWSGLGRSYTEIEKSDSTTPSRRSTSDAELYGVFRMDHFLEMLKKARNMVELQKVSALINLHMIYHLRLQQFRPSKESGYLLGESYLDLYAKDKISAYSLFAQFLKDENIDIRQMFSPDEIAKAEALALTEKAKGLGLSADDILRGYFFYSTRDSSFKADSFGLSSPSEDYYYQDLKPFYEQGFFSQKGYLSAYAALKSRAQNLIPSMDATTEEDRVSTWNWLFPEQALLEAIGKASSADDIWPQCVKIAYAKPKDSYGSMILAMQNMERYRNEYAEARSGEAQTKGWEDLVAVEKKKMTGQKDGLQKIFHVFRYDEDTKAIPLAKAVEFYRSYLLHMTRFEETGEYYKEFGNPLFEFMQSKIHNLDDLVFAFSRLDGLGVVINSLTFGMGMDKVISATETSASVFQALDFMLARDYLKSMALNHLDEFIKRALALNADPVDVLNQLDQILERNGLGRSAWKDDVWLLNTFGVDTPRKVRLAVVSALQNVGDLDERLRLLEMYCGKFAQHAKLHEVLRYADYRRIQDGSAEELIRLIDKTLQEKGKNQYERLRYLIEHGLVPTQELVSYLEYGGAMTDFSGYQTGPDAVSVAIDVMEAILPGRKWETYTTGIKTFGSSARSEKDVPMKDIPEMVRKGELVIFGRDFYFPPSPAIQNASLNVRAEKEKFFKVILDSRDYFLHNGLSAEDYDDLLCIFAWRLFYPTHLHQVMATDLGELLRHLRPSKYNSYRVRKLLGRNDGPVNKFVVKRMDEEESAALKKLASFFDLRGYVDYQAGDAGALIDGYEKFHWSGSSSRRGQPRNLRSDVLPLWAAEMERVQDAPTLEISIMLMEKWLNEQGKRLDDQQWSREERIKVVLDWMATPSTKRNRYLLDIIGDPLQAEDPSVFESVFPHLFASDIKDILAKRILMARYDSGAVRFKNYAELKMVIDQHFERDSPIRQEVLHKFLQKTEISIPELESLRRPAGLDELAKNRGERTAHRIIETIMDSVEKKPAADKREFLEWLMGVERRWMPKLAEYYQSVLTVEMEDLDFFMKYQPNDVRYVFLSAFLLGPDGVLSNPKEREMFLNNIFTKATGRPANDNDILFIIFREIFEASPQPKQLDLITAITGHFLEGGANGTRGENELIKDMLSTFGAVGVKIGQFLSGQREDVPGDLADVLEDLTDAVKPVSELYLLHALSKDIPMEQIATYVDSVLKLAGSGSIGQVYKVRLKDQREEALKYIRPMALHEVIENMEVLKEVLFKRLPGKNARLDKSLERISKNMFDAIKSRLDRELFVAGEMQDQEDVAAFARGSKGVGGWSVSVPAIDPKLKGSQFFASEFITGRPLDGGLIEELKGKGLYKTVAEAVVKQILEQMFWLGLYHADLHAGNIFIDVEKQRVFLLDFGNTGTLSKENQDSLVQALMALKANDDSKFIGALKKMSNEGDRGWDAGIEKEIRNIMGDGRASALFRIQKVKALLDAKGIGFNSEVEVLLKTFETIGYLFEGLTEDVISSTFQNIILKKFMGKLIGEPKHISDIRPDRRAQKGVGDEGENAMRISGRRMSKNLGGIDLDMNGVNISVSGDPKEDSLPSDPMLNFEAIKGFVPVVIGVEMSGKLLL